MACIVTVGNFIKASKNKFFTIWIPASLSKGYQYKSNEWAGFVSRAWFPFPFRLLSFLPCHLPYDLEISINRILPWVSHLYKSMTWVLTQNPNSKQASGTMVIKKNQY